MPLFIFKPCFLFLNCQGNSTSSIFENCLGSPNNYLCTYIFVDSRSFGKFDGWHYTLGHRGYGKIYRTKPDK